MNALRVMTAAYLFHGDSVLLLKRSGDRAFLPGIWSGVGGHVEAHEGADLRAACLREIAEETGLRPAAVQSLGLKYVLLRQRRHELRQQFVYVGRAATREVATTREGTLHWVPRGELLARPMTETNRLMLAHHLAHGGGGQVWVGCMHAEGSQPRMRWAPLSDWEG